jgi:3-ketoacyl-CoA synthase
MYTISTHFIQFPINAEFPSPKAAATLHLIITATCHVLTLFLAVASVYLTHYAHAAWQSGTITAKWNAFATKSYSLPGNYIAVASAILTTIALLALRSYRNRRKVYLLDFFCFRGPDHFKATYHRFVDGSKKCGFFDQASLDFQERILEKSALSGECFFPEGLFFDPPKTDPEYAYKEAEMSMFGAVEGALKKTGLKPRDIDILVVNCSLFCPTPSLAAMIINHFHFRNDVDAFSLGGMGCSAGIIAIDLARKSLVSRKKPGYALVVSTENITQNWYRGCDRSMLIPNTIFRMGAAATVLTNKSSQLYRCKYELKHLVKVHLGADDAAYRCVFLHPDDKGIMGVELNKDIVKVAAKAMTINMSRLGPMVLPLSEKLSFAANWIARRVFGMKLASYIPDFKRAFDHFCIHVGGRGVIEGIGKQLGLPEDKMLPSVNTLYWYGNTSSSTVWYSLGYVESAQGVEKGDLVWQIGFGSGFKCNSAVWKALRPIEAVHTAWEHLEGREEEAFEKFKEIQRENAAEKAAATKGTASNGNATANVALRNGKVLKG